MTPTPAPAPAGPPPLARLTATPTRGFEPPALTPTVPIRPRDAPAVADRPSRLRAGGRALV